MTILGIEAYLELGDGVKTLVCSGMNSVVNRGSLNRGVHTVFVRAAAAVAAAA